MTNKTFYTITAVLIIGSIIFWVNMFRAPDDDRPKPETAAHQEEISLTMYHSEGCNCCVKWAEYLEENGVNVTSRLTDNLQEVKEEHGVRGQLSSCHTAVADGYVIEGHVPVEDIRRLLSERPDAIGLSVPGMPPNSPGMDQPVENTYHSVLFDADSATVFNTHQ